MFGKWILIYKETLMHKKIILLTICTVIFISSKAQGGLFENWAVGVNAGLYGGGVQVATSLSPNIKLRAGFDYLAFNYNKGIDFDAPIVNIPGYEQDMEGELSSLKLKFPNSKIMIDYYPRKNGIFCLTVGLYVGNNKIDANGMINNYSDLTSSLGIEPEFEFEDVIIRPNRDGSFDATLKMGKTFKPYIGIGLGRTIPNSRIGFKFELGVVHQGKYTVNSSNVVQGAHKLNDMAADFDLPISKGLLDWWPMLNFALSYRIK